MGKKEEKRKSVRAGTRLDDRRQWARRNPNSPEARLQIRRLRLWQFVRWKTLASQDELTLKRLRELTKASDAPDSWAPDALESKVIRETFGRDWLGIPLYDSDVARGLSRITDARSGDDSSSPARSSARHFVMSRSWTLWRTMPLTPKGTLDHRRVDLPEFARVARILEEINTLVEASPRLLDGITESWDDWYNSTEGWGSAWEPVSEAMEALSELRPSERSAQDRAHDPSSPENVLAPARPRLLGLLGQIAAPLDEEGGSRSVFHRPPTLVARVFLSFEELYEHELDAILERGSRTIAEELEELEKAEGRAEKRRAAKEAKKGRRGAKKRIEVFGLDDGKASEVPSTIALRKALSDAQESGLLPRLERNFLGRRAQSVVEGDGGVEQHLLKLFDVLSLKDLMLERELGARGWLEPIDGDVEEDPSQLDDMIASQVLSCPLILDSEARKDMTVLGMYDLIERQIVRLAILLIDRQIRELEEREFEDSVPGRFDFEVAGQLAESWPFRLTLVGLVSDFFYRSEQTEQTERRAWCSAALLLRSYMPSEWLCGKPLEEVKKPEDTAQKIRRPYDTAWSKFVDRRPGGDRWEQLDRALPDPRRISLWENIGLWERYDESWRSFQDEPDAAALWARLQSVMSFRHPADRLRNQRPGIADDARRRRNESIGVNVAFQEAWELVLLDLKLRPSAGSVSESDWTNLLENKHSLWLALQQVLPEAVELNENLGFLGRVAELEEVDVDPAGIAAVRASTAKRKNPRPMLRR